MAKATYPDETPTPGYLLTDIARLTVANYTASAQLIEFLVARIKKDNHNIKFKCLQLIKHVCRTGRPDFKREMGRNVDVVKECLQYRGGSSYRASQTCIHPSVLRRSIANSNLFRNQSQVPRILLPVTRCMNVCASQLRRLLKQYSIARCL